MGFVPGSMEEYRPWLEEGFRRAGNGKGFHNFTIQASVHVEVENDVKAALQRLKPEVALYVGGMGHETKNFHNDIMIRRGFGDAAKRIQELYLAQAQGRGDRRRARRMGRPEVAGRPAGADQASAIARGRIRAPIRSASARASPRRSRSWPRRRG